MPSHFCIVCSKNSFFVTDKCKCRFVCVNIVKDVDKHLILKMNAHLEDVKIKELLLNALYQRRCGGCSLELA